MLNKPSVAVITASVYLVVYLVFFYSGAFSIMFAMFLAAPAVLIWMAYTILKHGKFNGKELAEDEEWGYSDRDKDSLGVF